MLIMSRPWPSHGIREGPARAKRLGQFAQARGSGPQIVRHLVLGQRQHLVQAAGEATGQIRGPSRCPPHRSNQDGIPMPDLDKDRLKTLEHLFDAFNRHDGAAVMAAMTDDIVFDAAAGPELCGRRIKGTADVRAAFEATFVAFADVSWECSRHAVFGDRGISEWIFRATTKDGGRIEAEGCDLFGFRGDKIYSKSAFRKDRPQQPAKAIKATSS
jgi:ketosteroid isomerase-like protein